MLRFNSESIVYAWAPKAGGEGLLIKGKLVSGRLGTKRQCLACGAKYYDLGRKPPVCSRCGAEAEPKRARGEPRTPPAAETPHARPQHSAQPSASQPIGREWSREQGEAID